MCADKFRNPKAEIRKKSEDQNPKKSASGSCKTRVRDGLDCSYSGFGLLSDFGLRISDLAETRIVIQTQREWVAHSAARRPLENEPFSGVVSRT
jgi:hypothetical protein